MPYPERKNPGGLKRKRPKKISQGPEHQFLGPLYFWCILYGASSSPGPSAASQTHTDVRCTSLPIAGSIVIKAGRMTMAAIGSLTYTGTSLILPICIQDFVGRPEDDHVLAQAPSHINANGCPAALPIPEGDDPIC
jgi:hypothetical protein